MEERSYCHGLLYELGSLDHLSAPDMKRRVVVDRIGVPAIALASTVWWQIQVSDLSIFRASQEEIGRRFRHNPLYSICMRSIDPRVRISITHVSHTLIHVLEPSPPSSSRHVRTHRRFNRPPTVLDVKDPDFSISCRCNEGAVVRMWHEFHREYVGSMACGDCRSKGKRCH